VHGHENEGILDLAYVNSTYQTGLRNLIDAAIMNHIELKEKLQVEKNYQKIDEIPFDFVRRRMSVVVRNKEGKHLLICKGAVEEVISLSKNAEADGKVFALGKRHRDNAAKLARDLNSDGFRVIALAYREMPAGAKSYGVGDEKDMTLLGFFAFLDPAKESAGKAIARLRQNGVRTKILTGDNEIVTKKICTDVGMTIHGTLSGAEIEKMADEKLSDAAENTTIFYKLSPSHKERIIRALQKRGHVLGFLGDGINDAPALRAADVGISVNSAVDIAKESSDIILLENSLLILGDGVLEGRRTFGNINKYLKMTASSNFGNMFSVVGASLFLPFLPMLPLQVLVNNLLYDMSQIPIPTDNVDEEYLTKPRQWRVDLLEKFVIFIGPISSIFDFLSYGMMIYVFGAWTNPALFQTGWFVESLLSQTLIIHVIRTNRIPFIQSRASLPLTIATLGICVFGMWLPFSPLADALGFVPLPPLYFVLLAAMLVTYLALTQLVKNWFIKKYALE
jgi:Mg2+-importing ATPase